jgi:hypothetical protein
MTTSIVSKKHLIEAVNGTDELFQIPDEYLENTLWVFVADTLGALVKVPTQYFQGGFFQISPAPAVNSDLYCSYDIEVTTEVSNLQAWDSAKIDELLETIEMISEAQDSLDKALLARVTQEDYDKWAELMESRIGV